MSRTHDSGGVPLRRPEPLQTREQPNDWGLILFFILVFVVMPFTLLMVFVYDEPDETGWNVDYVKRAAKACPPISARIDQMLADGRVTDDEQSIVQTLRDQARAAPGGLADCGTR